MYFEWNNKMITIIACFLVACLAYVVLYGIYVKPKTDSYYEQEDAKNRIEENNNKKRENYNKVLHSDAYSLDNDIVYKHYKRKE